MLGNNIATMSMGTKHLFEKYQNIEIVKIKICAMTSFLKCDLPIVSLKNKGTKIFNLVTAQILMTIYTHNCAHVIFNINFV